MCSLLMATKSKHIYKNESITNHKKVIFYNHKLFLKFSQVISTWIDVHVQLLGQELVFTIILYGV